MMAVTPEGEFEGLAGIVTGAGSGIGRAVALRLAAGGGAVLVVDVREEAAAATVAAGADLPGRLLAHRADVTSGEEVAGYVAAAKSELGPVAFFHNNAGVEGVHKSIVDTSEEEWDAVMAVNQRAAFLGLKHVIPAMRERGGGAIVNTGSILSVKAAPDRSDYVASKHAVLGLTRSAAAECAGDGIRVNAIGPGPIETPLMERSELLVNPDDPAFERKRFEEGTPLGRYGRPEEIADLVAYLLGPAPSYLTGSMVLVDGGITSV